VRWGIAFLMLGVLAFSGCNNEKSGGSTSDYEANKPKVLAAVQKGAKGKAAAAAVPAPKAEEMVQATMGTGYSYDPTDKRDPFRSFILDQAREAADREIGPLEQYDISQLRVVAVVWDTGLPLALVADPSGRPYVVNEGSAMGKNDGRVIKIDDGMVLVKETYVDWLGEKTTKDIEMRLAGGDKGGDLR
jgi:Tfp pilus assembly protein PilP